MEGPIMHLRLKRFEKKKKKKRERERIQSKALYHISKTLKTNNIKT